MAKKKAMTKKKVKKMNKGAIISILLAMLLVMILGCSRTTSVSDSKESKAEQVSARVALTEQRTESPKGLSNDPYPGSCAQYIDSDKNGICDTSE